MNYEIPIPVDPSERHLPVSFIQLKLGSGIFQMNGVPLQGPKTIQNILDTLQIWKPTLVKPERSLSLYDPEFRWSQMI